ncbi:MAG: hypothetical protein WCG80_05845 [Spirochaetales bacterium]
MADFLTMAAFVSLYVLFLFWYGGRSKALTSAETEAFLSEMRRHAGKEDKPGVEEPLLLRQFRDLAASDDGRDFWMVNLLKFREKALYPESMAMAMGDDPLAANARYNKAIIPSLLKHGNHPVFATRVTGRFIRDTTPKDWNQVAAVRYRSRRDMLRMAVDLAGKGIDVHKWAALERTEVFPVQPYLSLFFARFLAALVLAAVCAAMLFLLP